MTMFKKKSTKKDSVVNDIKKHGRPVTAKTTKSGMDYFTDNSESDAEKWEIIIRMHDDGIAIHGNTTKDQIVKFLLGWLFKFLECMLEENGFSQHEKLLFLLKWNLDIDKITRSLSDNSDEDGEEDED